MPLSLSYPFINERSSLQRQDVKITESLNMMPPARDPEGFSLVDRKQYFPTYLLKINDMRNMLLEVLV